MGSEMFLKSDEHYKFLDMVYNSAQLMREHGHTEPLVAVIGTEVNTFGQTFVINDFGTIALHIHSGMEPHTMHMMTETAYKDCLDDPRYAGWIT